MKKTIIAFCLLMVNVLCTSVIGMTRLQDHLTLLVYFIPIAIDFIIIILYCKENFKLMRSILLRLLLMLIFLILILCFAIDLSGSFFTSIIAVFVFVTIFNICPILLFFVISFFKKRN